TMAKELRLTPTRIKQILRSLRLLGELLVDTPGGKGRYSTNRFRINTELLKSQPSVHDKAAAPSVKSVSPLRGKNISPLRDGANKFDRLAKGEVLDRLRGKFLIAKGEENFPRTSIEDPKKSHICQNAFTPSLKNPEPGETAAAQTEPEPPAT